ncbi:MAG: hypothetical protein K0B15_13285 [Lentimicrobium sp.]|nr:hypothetical protein [Lentimicrobium sp.]
MKNKKFLIIGIVLLMLVFLYQQNEQKEMKTNSNRYTPEEYVKITHSECCKNATTYQINTRQFTQEGTFLSAEKQLPRLKELGIDI